jgi:hypothetical protein
MYILMKDRLRGIHDAQYIIDNRRREQEEVEQPHEKRCDQSPNPPGLGLRGFGRAMRKAQYPVKVRAPTNIFKYDGS